MQKIITNNGRVHFSYCIGPAYWRKWVNGQVSLGKIGNTNINNLHNSQHKIDTGYMKEGPARILFMILIFRQVTYRSWADHTWQVLTVSRFLSLFNWQWQSDICINTIMCSSAAAIVVNVFTAQLTSANTKFVLCLMCEKRSTVGLLYIWSWLDR